MKCVVCQGRWEVDVDSTICLPCRESVYRIERPASGFDIIAWAARRARAFERKRKKTTPERARG